MSLAKLMTDLREADIKLWVEDGRLKFDAPKGAMSPALRERMVAYKERILDFMGQSSNEGNETPIEPASRDEPLPLSFAQQRLWILDQLEPGSAAYNVPIAMRMTGPFRTPIFQRSLNAVIKRHESLRTRFDVRDGTPIQIIDPAEDLTLRPMTLTGETDHDREAEVQGIVSRETSKPFDLKNDKLIRVSLIEIGPEDHVLILVLHHIISDGWSMNVLVRELMTGYHAYVAGHEPRMPPMPIQYADFAVWQRGWLKDDQLERQLDYWKKHLGDGHEPLTLPTDRPRGPRQTFNGEKIFFNLSTELSEQVTRFSRAREATPFMTLLAAFGILLGRHANQNDIIIGTAIANRNRKEIEPLIGFFINMLAMRISITPQLTFTELVAETRRTALDAYAHQDAPFEQVVEACQVKRDPARPPLFQVAFDVQNAPPQSTAPAAGPAALSFKPLDQNRVTTKFDMSMSLTLNPTGLSGYLEYNTDLFDSETGQGLIDGFRNIVEAAMADPSRMISRLSMISQIERDRLLTRWNDASTSFPGEKNLAELFEARVAAGPDAVALSEGDLHLSYATLNIHANRLANQLLTRGLDSGGIVAVLAERSAEAIVAFLAIAKTGAAYLPLDPSFPNERLSLMLNDAKPAMLLTQSNLTHALPATKAVVQPMKSPSVDPGPSGPEDHNRPRRIDGEQLIYLIYTSGSTGVPKAVAVPHRAVVRLVRDSNYVRIQPHDRVAHASNIAFDAATFEIWGPLLNGARLDIIARATLLSPQKMGQLLRRREISTLFLTTALFNRFAVEDPTLFATLDQLLFGGEAIDPEPVRQVLAQGAPKRLLHVYGPTESTTYASWHPIEKVAADTHTIPIGKPLGNTELYVVDPYFAPVPLGVIGELVIGGHGLARAYWGHPGLTAEKFAPNPFSDRPGARLYRTGDLVSRNRDGAIVFQGRRDHQIKLRGYRIELGEIEAALVRIDAVRDAVVLMREDNPGDKRLVGYFVSVAGEPLDSAWLREQLAECLPDYMIPGLFLQMESFPLNINGKVDRRALPLPEREDDEETSVPPRNPCEEVVAAIWEEVINVQPIGVYDNFFELGGHSLMATQIVSRIHTHYNVMLPMETLFESPTVADLAIAIEKERPLTEEGPPPIEPVSRDSDLPLSFAQQRLWFIHQLEPERANYNMPMAIRLRGALNCDALARAFSEILVRHESLRTRFPSEEGSPVQRIDPPEPVALEPILFEDKEDSEQALARRLRQDALKPFNLAGEPPLRLSLFRLDPEQHVLMVTLHHIAGDGWSMGVLNKEIIALYTAFSNDQPSPLPEPAIQYADYAHWQRQWLESGELEVQLKYWIDHLEGAPPLLELPLDRPRPNIPVFDGATASFRVDKPTSDHLEAIGKEAGATLFMTLLAAWSLLLSRYANSRDLVIGSPIANRNHQGVEGLIGYFVNMLALRTDLSGDPSFNELLERTRAVTLDAYAHQDVPFERIVDGLSLDRNPSHTPLFQVVFALVNTPNSKLEIPGLEVEAVETGALTDKFDITLNMGEGPDGMIGTLKYNRTLFSEARIKDMLAHFGNLLRQIAEKPETPISNLVLMESEEADRLIAQYRGESAAYPHNRCLHQLFEDQVARTPRTDAVVMGERTLSFADLNSHANHLAARLRAQGVGPDVAVGVCMERCPEMIVALLGILKAGGAYLPLDPSLPAQQLHYILADTGAPLVVTKTIHGDCLPEGQARLALDSLEQDPAPIDNPDHQVDPEHLVYIIYTSGSTGRPKGVMTHHRGLVHFLDHAIDLYRARDGEAMAFHTTLAFDGTVLSLWPSLLIGLPLIIIPEERELEDLAELIYSGRSLSLVKITPAHLEVLNHLAPEGEVSVKVGTLVIGGEALSWSSLAGWNGGDTRVFNQYGSTETVASSFCYPIPDRLGDRGPVPLGAPMANTRFYVVDRRLMPVPAGVAGQMCIDNPGMARGYLGKAGLTAEKFVPNPFSGEEGGRMYLIGDLVSRRDDGALSFLGRIDHQVKIRGFRIELGELEAVLLAHGTVEEVVAGTREKGEHKHLIAWLRPSAEVDDQAGLGRRLRDYLVDRLPEYMIPDAFVPMSTLPLTPNGKIDRRALPEPNETSPVADGDFVAPRDSLELRLARLWEELLECGPLSVRTSFFEAGGHSLLAVRLMARIQREFGHGLPLATLFREPTIEQLANLLRHESGALSHSPLVPIQAEGDKTPIFCVHGVGGNVINFVHLAHNLDGRPFYGLQSPGVYGETPLTSIETMATTYLDAITEKAPTGPIILAGWSMGGAVAFEIARQAVVAGRTVAGLLLFDAKAPGEEALSLNDLELLLRFIVELGIHLDQVATLRASLSELPAEQRLAALLTWIEDRGIMPPDLALADLDKLYTTFIANYRALSAWRPQPYDGDLILFEALERGRRQERPNLGRGWETLTNGTVTVQPVNGSHFSLFSGDNAPRLSELVDARLQSPPTLVEELTPIYCTRPIIIIGMDRSGTSLVADMVHRWGAYGGDDTPLLHADKHNPKGFFEHPDVQFFNSYLLDRTPIWSPNFEQDIAKAASESGLREHALAMVRTMEDEGETWFWKEPMLGMTLPFWNTIWEDATFVITVRDPYESARSFEKMILPETWQGQASLVSATLLRWQFLMTSILKHTRNHETIFIPYEELLADPGAQSRRLAGFLDGHYYASTDDARIAAMSSAVDTSLYRTRRTADFQQCAQATPEQKALYQFIRARVADADLEFNADAYPMYAGWREYLGNLSLMRRMISRG